MPVPSHGRSASLNEEGTHCRSSKTFAKFEVHNGSVRPISDDSRIHQEPCNEGYEPWWIFRGLLRQRALQEQMFVPFAKATKTMLFVTSEPVGV